MVVIAHYNQVKGVLQACRADTARDPRMPRLLGDLCMNAKAYMDGVVKEGHTTKGPGQETILLQANLLGSLAALSRHGFHFPNLPHKDLCECLVTAMGS